MEKWQEELGKKFLAKAQEAVIETPAQPESAFDPDNFGQVLLIQVSRLYDVGMALLAVVDVEKAVAMAQAHAKGAILSPPPAFVEEEEDA